MRKQMKLGMLVPAKDTKKVMKRLKQSYFQIEEAEQSHDPDLLQIGSNNVDTVTVVMVTHAAGFTVNILRG